ncbi:AMIN-like domain-containing (lipo)protein [Oerskovia paurometabola]|uniref:AMIN-like domain-containing (lipo)protein n=1 Tax=Oerskovia paurometabola TaxID=162170 RepID=UPI00342319E0
MNGTTRRLRPAALSTGVVAALLALTACSGAGTDDETTGAAPSPTVSSPAPGPTASQSPSAPAGPTSTPTGSTDDDSSTDAPAFPANTEVDLADASPGAALTVTDIRIGRHDGFDRVVYEMGGTGTPGWRVEYVPQANEDGSGKVVPVDGDGTLSVSISGSGYPADTGVTEFDAPSTLRGAGTDEVEEVVFLGVFEGYAQSFVGTDEVSPFRVYALTDPTRVVVEVRNDDV